MTNIEVHLTLTEIITSVIIYGIVHSIWSVIKWCIKQLETEAGKIILAHVRSGHDSRFKHCFEDGCAKAETARDSLRPAIEQQ